MNTDDRSTAGSGPCAPTGYGPAPEAREAICLLAAQIEQVLARRPRGEIPGVVATALAPLLAIPALLAEAHCACQPETYRRHVLYADPARRFTILSLAWRPGHFTPVHGHRAWGVVGVYEGRPNVAIYACTPDGTGGHDARLTSDVQCAPGDVTHVQPGYGDVHKLYNATDERVLTIHIYGRDLVEDPASINLLVAAS